MNSTLTKAAERAAQAEALMNAIEKVAAGIEIGPQYIGQADRAENLFYLAEDLVCRIKADIEKLQTDERIVDVFRAAHDYRVENDAEK